jgi:hypothetical protein
MPILHRKEFLDNGPLLIFAVRPKTSTTFIDHHANQVHETFIRSAFKIQIDPHLAGREWKRQGANSSR